LEFQTALGGESVRKIREMCDSMGAAWGGARPVVYDVIEDIDAASLTTAKDYVQIGIEKETAGPFDFVFADMNGCVISGAPESGKTSLLGRILRGLLEDGDTTVYLYEKKPALESLKGPGKLTAAHDGAALDAMISALVAEYYRRIDDAETKHPRAALCIDDFAAAYGDISNDQVDALTTLIFHGGDFGIYTYITGNIDSLVKFNDMLVEPFVRCLAKGRAVAIGGRLADHRIFGSLYGGGAAVATPSAEDEVLLSAREARILSGGKARRIRLARFALESHGGGSRNA
jgi:hypothetical protein